MGFENFPPSPNGIFENVINLIYSKLYQGIRAHITGFQGDEKNLSMLVSAVRFGFFQNIDLGMPLHGLLRMHPVLSLYLDGFID